MVIKFLPQNNYTSNDRKLHFDKDVYCYMYIKYSMKKLQAGKFISSCRVFYIFFKIDLWIKNYPNRLDIEPFLGIWQHKNVVNFHFLIKINLFDYNNIN